VQNGWIHDLPLPAKGSRVVSVIGPAVEGTTIVKFQINNYFTNPGEFLAVTGDVPELGCWDLRHSAALEYINRDTWFNEIPFHESAGQPISFKFVVQREGSKDPSKDAHYENVLHRRYLLPKSGRVKLEVDWEAF